MRFIKIQGSVDGITWTDLSPQLTYAYNTFQTNPLDSTTVGTQSNNDFPITLNKGKYMSYRLYGVSGTTHWGQVTELFFGFNSFNRSMYPISDCVASVGDTDGDGKYNWMDLDSDGDGCSDAKEAGATTSSTTNFQFSGVVGTNGLVNTLETAVDNGVINYNSTYSTYGTVKALNVCGDFDNDGIGDLVDIDDDNDGILDVVELMPCALSLNTTSSKSAIIITSDFTPASGTIQTLLDNSENNGMYFTANADITNKTIFSYQLANMYSVSGFEISTNGSSFFNTGATYKIQASNDGISWTDLTTTQTAVTGTLTAGVYSGVSSTYKFQFTNYNPYKYYRVLGLSGSLSGGPWLRESSFSIAIPVICDTDNDGANNNLDLDSDGDGCSDALEGGATSITTANYQFTGAVGTNGLVNSLETAVDNGVINYTSLPYAYVKGLALCSDTDNDGLGDMLDIDDDNDGVLDVTELASCAVSLNTSTAKNTIGITSSATIATGTVSSLLDDTIANTFYFSGSDITNKAIATFTLPTFYTLTGFEFATNGSSFITTGATYKIQGSLDGSNWVDLTSTITASSASLTSGIYSSAATTNKFSFTNSTAYKYYRIFGLSGTLSSSPYVQEVYFSQATPIFCDTDNDGINNTLDLDSDGDGCSDAYEAGATTDKTANFKFTGAMGSNGFANSLETSTDNGIINYTYQPYAFNAALNACTDTDNDGIGDLVDIDDDNDGILDIIENPACSNFTNGSFETYTNCPNLSAAGTANNATGWTTYGGLSNTYSQLMIADGTACTSNKPADTWPASTALTGGSVGKGWAGGHQGENLQNVLTSPLPIGTYNLSFDAGNVIFSPYTNTVQTVKIYGLKSSDTDFAEPVAQLLATFTVNNVISSSSQVWKTYASSITTTQLYDRIHIVFGNARGDFSVQNTYTYIDNISFTCSTNNSDKDGDGIPNQLDLDSDGDGCSDALEGGATTNTTANYQFTGAVGANGLVNSLETVADNGVVNYNLTYTLYGLDATLNVCADSDNDGISDLVDIDDDNDGILDAVESPSCFYTATEISQIQTVSSELASYSTYLTSNTIDQSSSTLNAFTPSVNWVGKELYKVSTLRSFPLVSMSLDLSTWAISSSASNTFKLQGSNDNVSWTDLSGAVASTATTGTFVITNSLLPAGLFKYYRLIGVAGTSYYGGVSEIKLNVATTYNPSSYPKGGCTADVDSDGKLNHLDLDSDGDGCSDAKEGGATTSNTANYQFTGAVGTNGLVNSLETAVDNGVINYSSTYTQYALVSSINACVDTDNDGIADIVDIDDDNDGVLDTTEDCDASSSTTNQLNTSVKFTSAPTTVSGDSQIGYSYTPTGISFNPGGTVGQHNGVALLGPFTSTGVAVNVTAIVRKDWGVSSYGGTVKGLFEILDNSQSVVGSLTWQDNTSNGSTDANNQTINFSGTVPTGNYYIRIKDNGSTSTSSGWGDDWSVKELTISTQKCNWDFDNDGVPNRLDLDSDGDGCSDAYESGATASVVPNYQFTGAVGANGLVNSLETAVDNGVINYTSTYSNAVNTSIHTCPSCIAGTVAPALSSTTKVGVCPSTTIDLTSITASNLPAGTVLTWHTGSIASGTNKVANPSAVAGGTYYASFFDSANNCYSPTTLVTATSASCASGVIDCSKTQLYPAPVVGVSGQKVLYVTLNVSTSGCFSPLSVSGSGFSVANGVTQICTSTTGVQQMSIPVYYNGSSLGTMSFAVGTSGSCSADLTTTPKKAVVDMWTIECLPTQGPVLR